ncbi:hypothetical protein KXD40_000166 [Peronospora effusa]|nr:hypothetical protein KXD40_000166 [Peronospora effusa]
MLWYVYQAFDLFLESANHPTFLRTGLPGIDQALNGGLHCRTLSEVFSELTRWCHEQFVGTAGIGKSQAVMTLAVITIARIRQTHAGQEADINELAAAVIQRIRYEVQNAIYSLKTKLLIIDCVATLFLKDMLSPSFQDIDAALSGGWLNSRTAYASNAAVGKRVEVSRPCPNCFSTRAANDFAKHMFRLFADTYQVFVVVTNRATTIEGDDGLYTKPQLGDSWAHCVTTRLIMEQHSLCRAITIVKSSVAGYVVQPFTVKEGGIEAVEDASDAVASDDFTIHDKLLSDMALTGRPLTVDPGCTVRSTQQSNAEDLDATQPIGQSDEELQSFQQEEAQETGSSSFDIVSDSNSNEDHESFEWDIVTEE